MVDLSMKHGNLKYKKLLEMAIEIVDIALISRVIFHSYVSLPEGKSQTHRQMRS